MCGIAGFVDFLGQRDEAALRRLAGEMSHTLAHRGPDGEGVWADADAGVALAQRRLAIVDLSPAGAQPMVSACGRYVLVYNGEAYNAADLRPELEARGIVFRGHSDTEVVLEGCAAWGVEATLRRLNGMFALALWDRGERRLTLARDRLGIKPLYWSEGTGAFLFGSELKALKAHPACPSEVDRDAVTAFLRHNYVPAPQTIFRGIRKLRPGCLLTLGPGGNAAERAYWSLADVEREAQAAPFSGDDAAAVDALHDLLSDAVRLRMISDVPLGAFLSGGIDSSTVAALMQAQSGRPVKTFSIGFPEADYDEARHAAAVARHLGTDHTEFTVTAAEAREVIPLLAEQYDEPFSDSSQIPTFLVSRLTRREVTVALSGDGGDELFFGYSRYALADTHARRLFALPRPLRAIGAALLRALPPSAWDAALRCLPPVAGVRLTGDRLHKLAEVMGGDLDAFYRRLVSHWENPEEVAIGGHEPRGAFGDPGIAALVPDFRARMAYLDILTYLPDDILTKVDRASMAVSLEARVPILDHRVVAFSRALPHRFKVREGTSKWLLRQVLYRHVPRDLVDRPKMGFGVPLDEWLRGPLREWAEDLLSPTEVERFGLVRAAPVAEAWREHLSGRRNRQYDLWDVLMLQSWCRRWM